MSKSSIGPAWWMLAGAVFFALMGVQTHALGGRCDWLIVAMARAIFMFASTAVMAMAAGKRLHFFRPRTLWVRSLMGSVSLVCNFYALAVLPVSDALTLSSMYPLWILLFTAVGLRQMPSVREWVGVGSAFLGVVLVQQPHFGGSQLATYVAVLSSVSTAAALLGLHRLRTVDSRAVVAHFAGVASVVSLIWLLVGRPDAIQATRMDVTTIAMLAGVCVSGTLGQLCLTRAYAHGVPTRIAVIGLSQVAFAAVFDVVAWGRTLQPATMAGMLLVLAPTALLMASAQSRLAALRKEKEKEEALPKDEDRPMVVRSAEAARGLEASVTSRG